MKNTFLIIAFLYSLVMNAQDASFTASVSMDSVLLGNYIEVSFTLKNGKETQFDAPQFEGFQIVGGPNQSSSFQMVNGNVNQEVIYSYYLEPLEIGTYFIPPATVEMEDGFLETTPLEINVYPNPDGIKQSPQQPQNNFHFFDFPRTKPSTPNPPTTPQKPKKKRKIYKM